MPQITIVILQYRPDAAVLRRTLASLAMQDTRDFAVVLGDDGSAQDYFAESRAYLAAHGITDVQTTKLQPNGGTVKNARNAVRAAATRWVLMLSPGISSTTAKRCAGGWDACRPTSRAWPSAGRPTSPRSAAAHGRRDTLTAHPMTPPTTTPRPSAETCYCTTTGSAARGLCTSGRFSSRHWTRWPTMCGWPRISPCDFSLCRGAHHPI
ncbi:glycosyltransferase [Gemmiger formicilis]|nr:glycosyltransferase [Gemmiger formicilis]